MEPKQKLILLKPALLSIMLGLTLISCQKEFIDTREPDKSVSISANDYIADLILRVVLKDGSYDNFIDECTEISINFPYSVLIDDEQYIIHSKEDIDHIKLYFFFDRDDIEIVYPVTISHSDYSEFILSNSDELEQIQEQYNNDLNDDDIECIDFVYPLEIALYNTLWQTTDVVTVDNDYEMYSIFNNIEDLIVEISFPIVLELASGQQISVNNNIQLEDEIDQVIDNCDEDDEVEFSDEEYPLAVLITSDEWSVSFYSDTTDETSSFSEYTFDFGTDQSVRANNGTDIIPGDWEFDVSDSSIFLEIEFDTDDAPLVWLNNDWLITNANTNEIQLEAESDSEGYIKMLMLVKSD